MATTLEVNVNVNPALAALDKLQAKLNKLTTDFSGVFESANRAAMGLQATLIGLGAATAAFADDISDVAKANDTTIASILGLSSALQQAGGKADSVGQLFSSLSNAIDAANSGNDKIVSSFAKVGVSIKDLGTLTADQIRGKVLQGLTQISDSATRNAVAFDILGRAAKGVDFTNLAGAAADATAKYGQFEGAVNTAGDAFDRLGGLVKDLKIAFAVAFEPVFKYIAETKVGVDDLVGVFKALVAVLAGVTSVAIIGGLAKIVDLLKVMAIVAKANPLLTIAGAVVSLGTAAATYLTVSKEIDDAQKKVTDETTKTSEATQKLQRDQSDLLDKRKKELDSLLKIRQAFDTSLAQSQKKLDLELGLIGASEEQKRIAQDIAQIETQTQQALLNLKQANDALSRDAQARNATAYAQEYNAIVKNGEESKRQASASIALLNDRVAIQRRLSTALDQFANTEARLLQIQVEGLKAGQNQEGIIRLNERLAGIENTRAKLQDEIKKNQTLTTDEQRVYSDLVTQVTTDIRAISGEYGTISESISKLIQKQVESGDITVEQANKFRELAGTIVLSTSTSAGALERAQVKLSRQSRSFSEGWRKAFNDYADSATNAAAIATRVFDKFTSGLEDAIVDFVKTGKFEWKKFVNDMAEELLRAQIKQTIASFGQAFGLGSLFGGGAGPAAGSTPNNPLYVIDISGGGTGGGIGSVFGSQAKIPQQTGGGSIFGTIGNVFGGVVDTAKSVFGGISDAVSSIFGGSSGGFGTGDLFGNMDFGGFFAQGGTIPRGKYGIVGESGPEMVTGPATVTPMGTTNVTYNIQAVDAASFQALVARDPGFIHAVAMQGAKSVPQRR